MLFGMLAYLVTPLGAAGAEGEPVGFAINIRFVLPAMLAGAALLPLAPFLKRERWQWVALAALLAVLVLTDRPDMVLRDPSRLFGLLVAALAVLVPAALVYLFSRRPAPLAAVAAAFAGLALVAVAVGYPVQRHYLSDRFGPGSGIPGYGLDPAYVWARDKTDAKIGLVGTSAGFVGYGFYGTDLSNDVQYLGVRGPTRCLQRDPDLPRVPCRGQRGRSRLPGHRAIPQLHPPRPADPLARGGVAAGRGGRRAASTATTR